MKIGIYIPSRGRAGQVRTLAYIPNSMLINTHIVCTRGEGVAYCAHYRQPSPATPQPWVIEAPKSVTNIGAKRDFIVQHAAKQGYSHIIMMDDDLKFARRRVDDPTKFLPFAPTRMHHETKLMLNEMFTLLCTHAHVGIVSREGANRHTAATLTNHRMMRVLGYNIDVLRQHKIKFTRLPLMEDFDVTLQLLRAGYPNAVITGYTNDQNNSNAPGGCSTYRTGQLQAEAAHKLAALHPGFVKVVTRPDKGGWGGERVDVQVAWKKAFASFGDS